MSSIDRCFEARDLLQESWSQGAFAKDQEGNTVSPHSEAAVSFDLLGAFTKVSNGSTEPLATLKSGFIESIPYWQDEASFEEVMACVDETIATLRSRLVTDRLAPRS